MDDFILWADAKYGHKNILRVERDRVVLMSGEVVSINVFYAEGQRKKEDEIGKYIYSHYTEQKQGQDRGYQAYSQTVIVGTTAQQGSPVTLDELTIEVMGAVLQVWDEAITLSDYLTVKPIELQEHYAKLVKIGSRLKWTKMCIDEGKLAMVESREPSYPPYPTFGGA